MKKIFGAFFFDLINDQAVNPLWFFFLKIASQVNYGNQCALYHRSTCCLENERATFCRSTQEGSSHCGMQSRHASQREIRKNV